MGPKSRQSDVVYEFLFGPTRAPAKAVAKVDGTWAETTAPYDAMEGPRVAKRPTQQAQL